MTAAFELDGALGRQLPALVVGPWTRPAPGALAFDAGAPADASLWRVSLARDLAANRAVLARGERGIAAAHAALDELPRRFDRAIAQAIADPRADRAPAAASATRDGSGSAPPVAPAELDRALIAMLIDPAAQPTAFEAPLDFTEPGDLAGLRGVPGYAASGGLEAALQRIADLVRGRARIETRIDGALVAASVMALAGNTELYVGRGLSAAGAQLHARSVGMAVRTRDAWLRILALVVGCGARLAALGWPAVGVAGLPLVWRFVRGALREARA